MIIPRVSRMGLTMSSALIFGWLSWAVPAWAQSGDPANSNFVSRLNFAITSAAATSKQASAAAQRFCEDLSVSVLDLDMMMSTASAGAYAQLSGSHRDAYRSAFVRRIIKDCATNAVTFMAASVELTGVRSLPSGERIVGTRSTATGAERILMWQVRPHASGKLMVTDVLSEGRSAMLSLRDQASLALERNPGDISALIQSLER